MFFFDTPTVKTVGFFLQNPVGFAAFTVPFFTVGRQRATYSRSCICLCPYVISFPGGILSMDQWLKLSHRSATYNHAAVPWPQA